MHDPGPAFRALHQPGNPFILANAWDRGSAQVLAAMGAQAIGTSSAAHAFTLGRPDGGTVSRDEALAHAEDLVAATPLPVSGDFENGFGDAPEDVAETVRLSAEAGLAGICIEDTVFPSKDSYAFDLAVERIRAGAAAARALSRDFFLLARADGILAGNYGQDEALRRARAFDDAGADGLYVPLPASVEDQSEIIKATSKPVNVLAVGRFAKLSVADLAAMGAARISLGSGIARATHRAIVDAGRAMFEEGHFEPLSRSISGDTVNELLEKGARDGDH